MSSTKIIIMTLVIITLVSAALAQTPPIQPKVQQTPLPPPVELPAPPDASLDASQKPLTVDEAVAIALQKQPDLVSASADVSAAQGRVKQERSGLLPTLDVGAGYTNQAIVRVKGTPAAVATSSGYQLSANLRQLLYDFNNTRDRVRRASAIEKSAAANLARAKADLVLRVKEAFYNLNQDQRLVAVYEANLRNQQNHLESARARLNGGLGMPADVVRAETAVSNAVFNLNLARNNASISRVDLAELMGIDPRTPFTVAESSEPALDVTDVNALVDIGLKNRPEVTQACSILEADEYGVKIAKTTNSPAIVGSVGWLQRGSDFPPDNNSLTYGAALVWTPFDAGLTRGRVQEARANLQASQAEYESLKLSIKSEISRAYLNMKTAEQRLVTADAEVANAEEALRLVDGRYQAGLGTFLDVLDAQTSLVTARTNRVNAQTTVDIARAALVRAIGGR